MLPNNLSTFFLCGISCALAISCRSYTPLSLDLPALENEWQDSPATDTSSFDIEDAVTMALARHPDLTPLRIHAESLAKASEHAGVLPDPKIGLGLGWNLSNSAAPLLANFQLGFILPLSNAREHQRQLAQAEAAIAKQKLAFMEREVATQVRLDWSRHAYLNACVANQTISINRMEQWLSQLETLANLGEVNRMALRQWEVQLVQWQDARLSHMRDIRDIELSLGYAMGLHPQQELAWHTSLTYINMDDAAKAPAVTSLYTTHPLAKLKWAQWMAAESTYALEVSGQYPNLDIGPKWSIEEDEHRAGIGLNWRVPLWNRNEQNIATAQGLRDAAAADYQNCIYDLTYVRQQALNNLQHALERISLYEESELPALEQQIQDTLSLISKGEMPADALLQAQQQWLDAQIARSQAQLDAAKASAGLRCGCCA